MAYPSFVEELRRRYLADEASVFLLHGAIDGLWDIDGKPMNAAQCLAQMLAGSRQILATYQPGEPIRFHGPSDQAAFTRLVEARQSLEGRRDRNLGRTPEDALGLLWMALGTPGPAQGYIISGLEQLVPARKKHIEPLRESAPPLWEWARDPGLRASNNVVIFLAKKLEDLRAELPAGCAVVAVPPPSPAPPPPASARAAAVAEIEAALATPAQAPPPPPEQAEAEVDAMLAAAAPAPPPPKDAAEAEVNALGGDLATTAAPPSTEAMVNAALRAAILRHPTGAWPGNLPAREALAAVLHDLAPQRCGPLVFTVSEGQVQSSGPGAAWFDQWYATDVAVDAAAGMALGSLVIPEGGFDEANLPELTSAAVRALGRRLDKALASE